MKRTGFWILLFFCFFCLLELSLQAVGLVATSVLRHHRPAAVRPDENAVRIMFIGDSWTYGAEAKDGRSYVETFASLLKKKFPGENIQFFNYAYPCSNSAQCLYQFLDHYQEVKPDILLVLCGPNNSWNTTDVDRVRLRVATLLDHVESGGGRRALADIASAVTRLKTVKLARLTYYNLFERKKERKIATIASISDNPYAWKMHELINRVSKEAAREYLVEKRDEAKDYEQFFRFILYTFGDDFEKAKEFLEGKELYRPDFLKDDLDKEAGRQSKYVALHAVFLVEHLDYLRRLCRKEGILLVVQTYPHFESMQSCNIPMRGFCARFGVLCVDHYDYFERTFSAKAQKKMFTNSHPNNQGHRYMAQNLLDFFIQKKLMQAGSKKARSSYE